MDKIISLIGYIANEAPEILDRVKELAKAWATDQGIEIPELREIKPAKRIEIDRRVDDTIDAKFGK